MPAPSSFSGRRYWRSVTALSGLAVFAAAAALAFAAPGDLDTSFDGDGRTTIFDEGAVGRALAIQPDGKIVVAGNGGPEADVVVTRLLAGGAPDTSFGGDGTATLDLGGNDEASAVAVQPDGKVVVAGSVSTGEYGDRVDAVVIRLTATGSPDTSFGPGGRRVFATNGTDRAKALAVQADGRILVAGAAGINDDLWIARLQSTGAVDTSFNKGTGAWTGDLFESEIVNSLAVQADGKILGAGVTTLGEDSVVVRLLPDGTPDGTFGSRGVKILFAEGNQSAETVLLGADGGIVVAGTDANDELSLARLDALGAADTTFDLDGRAVANIEAKDAGRAAVLQPNGKIVVVGQANVDETSADIAVARFLANGALDSTFSGDGRMTVDFGSNESANGVALQPDGKLVVTGSSGTSAVVARIDGDVAASTPGSRPAAPNGSTMSGAQTANDSQTDVGLLTGGPSRKGFGVPTCGGRQATIVGTARGDILRGTPGPDVILGREGDDIIRGLGGNDIICGGPGSDVLIGGNGADRIFGGGGRDRLFGDKGRDALIGGRHRDVCKGAGQGRSGCETR